MGVGKGEELGGVGEGLGKKPGKLHNPPVHKVSEFQNQPGRRVKLE